MNSPRNFLKRKDCTKVTSKTTKMISAGINLKREGFHRKQCNQALGCFFQFGSFLESSPVTKPVSRSRQKVYSQLKGRWGVESIGLGLCVVDQLHQSVDNCLQSKKERGQGVQREGEIDGEGETFNLLRFFNYNFFFFYLTIQIRWKSSKKDESNRKFLDKFGKVSETEKPLVQNMVGHR